MGPKYYMMVRTREFRERQVTSIAILLLMLFRFQISETSDGARAAELHSPGPSV